jgi:hypothetical protein
MKRIERSFTCSPEKTLTCGTIISPTTTIKSSTPILAHSLLLPPTPAGPSPTSPNSIPIFLARSKKSHKKSPFFNRTFPPDKAFASKKTKGRTNSVLRTASFVARYCFRNASFSDASLARADLVCALACTATELEGFRRFLTSEVVGPPSSSSSCCAVVMEVVFFSLTLGSCASPLLCLGSASSSSSPNESPIFFTPFFRFLKPAGLGVCSLYLVRQFLLSMRHNATRRAHMMKTLPTRSPWRAFTTSAASTAGQFKSFGASLAEIRKVHQADCLLFEEIFCCVAGRGEAWCWC